MPKAPMFYDQYNPPGHPGTVNDEPSMTKQEFKEECDINRIMSRYIQTGELPPAVAVGSYGDFSDAVDFMTAQNIIKTAEAQFMALPGEVRARFNNDPAQMLDFVHNKDNADEARKLGLLNPLPEVKPVEEVKSNGG